MGEHFCLHCLTLLSAPVDICPTCGQPTSGSSDDYRESLLHALRHPLADVRARAITALGLRRDRLTGDALVACALRNPTAVVEGLQVIEALKVLDGGMPHLAALHYLHARHPARAVREAAAAAVSASSGPKVTA